MAVAQVRVRRRDRSIVDVDIIDALALIAADDALDLPEAQVHQRPACVEFFAVVHNVACRIAGKPLKKAADFRKHLAGVPFDLVAPDGTAAFLQPVGIPPTKKGDNKGPKRIDFEALGATPAGKLHALKPTMTGSARFATLNLIAGLRGPYGGVGRPGAMRAKVVTLFPSDDGSFSSEVLHLSRVMPSDALDTGAADHLLWAKPWIAEEVVDEYFPRPFLDCAPVRLREVDGGYAAIWVSTDKPRVDAPEGWVGDPHTAQGEKGGPYTMTLMRDFTPRAKHRFLFGSPENGVTAPTILYDTPSKPVLIRVTAQYYGKGSTVKQAYESIYSTRGGQKIERAHALSTMALNVMDVAERILRQACGKLYREKRRPGQTMERAMPHTLAVTKEFAGRLGEQTVIATLQLLGDPAADNIIETMPHELRTKANAQFNVMATRELRRSWALIVRSEPIVAAARATLEFESALSKDLPTGDDDRMAKIDTTAVWSALTKVSGMLKSEHMRAPIRSSGRTGRPAMEAVRVLATLPAAMTATAYQEAIWLQVIRGLAHFRHGDVSFGRALYDARFHEIRLDRLLGAPNDALPALIEEAVDILASKNSHINMTDIIALALAPEGSDERNSIALKIAKDFVRGEWGPSKPSAASSQPAADAAA